MRSRNNSLRWSRKQLAKLSGPRRRLALALVLTAALLIFATSALASLTFIQKWGTSGSGDGQFLTPTGIAVDSAGNVYVAEGNGNRFQEFDSSGGFQLKAGIFGDVEGGFVTPSGIAVDSLGNIYVSDNTTDRVSKFNSSGVFVLTWGGSGSGDGKFLAASGVAVDTADNIYVSDTNNHRIQKFTSAGVFLAKWGSSGSTDGLFNQPQGLATDSADNVYVADTANNRIQKFTSAGVFITKWGTAGSGDGQFSSPTGVSADSSGTVFVADQGNNRIQSFSAGGTFIEAFGSAGSGDGQFSGPQDVAADAFGNVYVADTGNDRVQKLGAAAAVVANAGADQTVECAGATTSVTLDGTASTGGGTLSYEWKEGTTVLGSGATLTVSLPSGSHTITLTVTSSAGGSDDDTVVINVVDTTAPVITLNGQTPSMWPPNHKYHTFGVTDFVTSVTDSCGTTLGVGNVVISQVTSDEVENNGGDGNTLNDIVIAPDCRSVQLRSEREGGGNGRVYTITFRVVDASGNATTATARVTVPKSQGSGPAVDDGPHYTVTGACP